MSSWHDVWDPLPYHLKEKAVESAKFVWREIGGVVVTKLSRQSHLVRLAYIPKADGTPEAIAVHLLEPQSTGQQADTIRYRIDVINNCVEVLDGSPVESVLLSEEYRGLLQEVEAWVREIPVRENAKKEMDTRIENERAIRAIRQLKERLEQKEKQEIQKKDPRASYEQRLPELSGRKRKRPEEHPQGHCPTCFGRLLPCSLCGIVSCPQSGCPGQGTDLLTRLSPQSLVCFSCRTAGNWKDRPAAQCPDCKATKPNKYLFWCEGTVKGQRPAHKPKVIGCMLCGALNGTDGDLCSNVNCKMRQSIPFSRACKDCLQYGRTCTSHPDEWYCSFCKDAGIPTCPTCGEKQLCSMSYRARCRCGQIESCFDCLGLDEDGAQQGLDDFHDRLSDDEEEEDEDPVTVNGKPAVRFTTSGCHNHRDTWDTRFCAKCIKKLDVRDCDGCRNAFCKPCRVNRTCDKHGLIEVCKSCNGSENCKRCTKRYREMHPEEELQTGTLVADPRSNHDEGYLETGVPPTDIMNLMEF
ncbi:hypothetical protein OE88DRAFT_1666496 [Heliocybe sulcata]|uniref:Uncharacterized protein n=1 Tax=Heliocybe sulcata TaxID=5364 RepID=A0A5C3MQX0_9AGAM|nr:hypothetical protein OE88DRAFT_1666496 [Heliocybe sulcata]